MERLQRIAGQRPDFQVASTAGEHTRVKVEAAPSLALLGSRGAWITVLFGMRPLHGWRDAQIALLDEPTAGLDPQATIELLEIIRNLKDRNVSVLLSSHMLERVQSVCDRVALFNKDSIVLIGTVPELGRRVLGGGLHGRD
jgi:ABC-type hemin transport system ATPase subunit